MTKDAIKATLRTTIATLQGTLDAMLAEDAKPTCNRTTDRKAVRTTDAAPLMIGLYEARYEAPTKSERVASARPAGDLSPASINSRNRTFYESTEGV